MLSKRRNRGAIGISGVEVMIGTPQGDVLGADSSSEMLVGLAGDDVASSPRAMIRACTGSITDSGSSLP